MLKEKAIKLSSELAEFNLFLDCLFQPLDEQPGELKKKRETHLTDNLFQLLNQKAFPVSYFEISPEFLGQTSTSSHRDSFQTWVIPTAGQFKA